MRSSGHRTAAVFLTSCVAVLTPAVPAAAHVTVDPSAAEQGGYGKFSFRVPNERPVATTKVEVVLPEDHPVTSVSVRPLPGWQVKIDKTKLAKPVQAEDGQVTEAVTKITWSGGTIASGQFQEFDVSMGPLPKDTDRLVLKALQTYASGEVVRWIQVPQEGEPEPEAPAPVLELAPAGDSAGDGHHGSSARVAAQKTSEAGSGGNGSDTVARILGGLGLLVGLAGIGVAFLALRRRDT